MGNKICIGCGIEFWAKKNRIRYCSKGCANKKEKSAHWKGDSVSLKVLHKWVERQLGRPTHCSKCSTEGKVDLANKSNQYKRDISDWEWLCRKCHMKSDGRLEKFLCHSKKKKIPNRICPQCGGEFKPINNKSKYCSMSCRSIYVNKNIRIYRKSVNP